MVDAYIFENGGKHLPLIMDTFGWVLNLSVSRRTAPYAKIPCGFSIAKEVLAHVKVTPLGRQDSMQSIGIAEAYISLFLRDLH